MKKKIIILLIALSTILCGCCKSRNEIIAVYGKSVFIFDNININLKNGYWVRDYHIDYENNVITFDLDKEE